MSHPKFIENSRTSMALPEKKEFPRVRVREHVNPLNRKYQIPVAVPSWSTVYPQPTQPLHLDIGCGRGRFLWKMAALRSDWNFLGLEIRQPLVDEANRWRDEVGFTHLHYLSCNANTSLQPLLDSLPAGVLQFVSIQFPDPWFKRRHQKRRVVQPTLVNDLAAFLAPGGTLFLQSDVEAVVVEMRDRFLAHPAFHSQTALEWLPENPLPIRTERELSTLSRGAPIYRVLLTRVNSNSINGNGGMGGIPPTQGHRCTPYLT
jgi:tRNA (guanine-N7-)-methyltransferase